MSPSMLEINDDRRSRSKSPSGRGRERSRSYSRDDREPTEWDEYKRSSKKSYESEEDDDDRRAQRKITKKYADESDEDDRYRSYTSRRDYDDDGRSKYKDSSSTVTSEYSQRRPEYERSRPSDYERSRPKESRSREDEYYQSSRYETREPKDKKYYEDQYEPREVRSTKSYDDDGKYGKKEKKYYDDRYGSSPEEVTRRMSSLSVGTGLGAATLGVARHNSYDGGRPPASPLLEAYQGTYQSISPMPSALVLAKDDSDLSDLELELDDRNADLKRKIRTLEKEKEKYSRGQQTSTVMIESSKAEESRPRRLSSLETDFEIREPGGGNRERTTSVSIMSPGGNGTKKAVWFYDPEENARRIAAALSGTRSAPDPRPLIEILPRLSTDDLLVLRAEYKKIVKVGGQGINMAKHIKMRVPGNLGKAAYTTALGRWESEAYWANSWYQGGASRRELLIESLMGRSNSDIREIKNCFRDKKYNDNLERCIVTELKADKFRMAILLALEERRMPESQPLDIRLVKEDVAALARALNSSGGETDMIKIIVVRSDRHLREVLRMFERTYHVNFARQMIQKSRNLVGETLAHILNGALNRPMRDALLLHQAISETAPGKERTELLISRLVRMHWEPKHQEKVKEVFRERYGWSVRRAIQSDVLAKMKTPEGRMCAEFCIELVLSSEDRPAAR